MRKSFIATVTVLSSVACGSFVDLASADLVGSYQTGAGSSDTMTVYYRNDQAVRVDVGEGRYMLITGSNVYMVENEGGRTTAVDMDQMGAALQRSGQRRRIHRITDRRRARPGWVIPPAGPPTASAWRCRVRSSLPSR